MRRGGEGEEARRAGYHHLRDLGAVVFELLGARGALLLLDGRAVGVGEEADGRVEAARAPVGVEVVTHLRWHGDRGWDGRVSAEERRQAKVTANERQIEG